MMTVAVLGAGIVGRTLAAGWTRAGHQIVLGSREPGGERMAGVLAELGPPVTAATHADAARAAEVVVVTVPGDQVEGLIGELDGALDGRPVIDATNLLGAAPVLHHVDALAAAGGVVSRAFNSVGWEQMAQPRFGEIASDMPWAGPDGDERVPGLIADLGFQPVWLGDDPDAFALTDQLGKLWFRLVFTRGWDRRLGLRLLTPADD